MIVDITKMPPQEAYFTLTQVILPRPVAWVLSDNENKSLNLAPFSYFNAVSSDPPIIMFSVGTTPTGQHKDTLVNIKRRKKFVVNLASDSQLGELNATSATLPYGISEISENNIELAEADGFTLPYVAGCKIAMMCNRYDIQKIGNGDQALIFGEITSLYLADDCAETLDNGRLKIHAEKVSPLARLGAGQYASFGEIMEAKRPD